MQLNTTPHICKKFSILLLPMERISCIILFAPAGVMELVDVVDSKSTAGDSVPVRVRSPAPKRKTRLSVSSFLGSGGFCRLHPLDLNARGRQSRPCAIRPCAPNLRRTCGAAQKGRFMPGPRFGFGFDSGSYGIYTVLMFRVGGKLALLRRFFSGKKNFCGAEKGIS